MAMITLGVYEAKTRLSELIKLANAGRRVVITKHDEPVAELIPYKEEPHD